MGAHSYASFANGWEAQILPVSLQIPNNQDIAMPIRPATESDLPAILAIYNQVIATSTAVYRDDPVTLEDRQAWFNTRTKSNYPVLVATESINETEKIIGFASFGDYRASPGYRFSVEHTVHIHPEHRGQGIGRQLIEALIPSARNLGKHAMVGGVDSENAASIRFHQSLGFEQVAHFRQIGYKFDRWLDLLFFQKIL
jgi:L-amino acid N-acyltransferase